MGEWVGSHAFCMGLCLVGPDPWKKCSPFPAGTLHASSLMSSRAAVSHVQACLEGNVAMCPEERKVCSVNPSDASANACVVGNRPSSRSACVGAGQSQDRGYISLHPHECRAGSAFRLSYTQALGCPSMHYPRKSRLPLRCRPARPVPAPPAPLTPAAVPLSCPGALWTASSPPTTTARWVWWGAGLGGGQSGLV